MSQLHAQTGTTAAVGASTPDQTSPVTNHGGPIMPGPHDVYFIWYGNWAGNTATTILPDFVNGLNGSQYFNINSVYNDGTGESVDDLVSLNGQVFDSYSQGTSLSATQVFNVVNTALISGSLPYDSNGIYFVLTSPDVTQTSNAAGTPGAYCQTSTPYCGWHYVGSFEGKVGRVAFVGDPALQCPHTGFPSCSAQSVTPNGNEGADAMANIIAHELSETVTDPGLFSWFDSSKQEIGDKCSFMFGPTFTTSNGAQANITLGGRNFLIQQLWTNSFGCVMALPPPPQPTPTPAPTPKPITCSGHQDCGLSKVNPISTAKQH